ncbi:MAG: ATP-binding cassette domain-containing protein [Tissierellia bacterium]|nr:ATP-binding cassette domain-containing protein [Tissierellia bacterium]
MTGIIKTCSLTKSYKDKLAVGDINITVEKGDIYGLIGRNGAGKTTILKMITGLIFPSSGRIEYNFEDENKANNIGLLIESPGLFEEFDARTNIRLKMLAVGFEKKGYEDYLLDLVGLAGVKKKVKNFSLGMKQRLGLALALVGDPEVLILDEATNGMDPQGMKDFRELIVSLARDKKLTFIISSHILDELAKYANRFAIIDRGKLIREISNKDLEKIKDEKIVIKSGKIDRVLEILKENLQIERVEITEENDLHIYDKLATAEINGILARNKIFVDEIYLSHESLENYYLRLTGEKNA